MPAVSSSGDGGHRCAEWIGWPANTVDRVANGVGKIAIEQQKFENAVGG